MGNLLDKYFYADEDTYTIQVSFNGIKQRAKVVHIDNDGNCLIELDKTIYRYDIGKAAIKSQNVCKVLMKCERSSYLDIALLHCFEKYSEYHTKMSNDFVELCYKCSVRGSYNEHLFNYLKIIKRNRSYCKNLRDFLNEEEAKHKARGANISGFHKNFKEKLASGEFDEGNAEAKRLYGNGNYGDTRES